jgi:hypothetical protein
LTRACPRNSRFRYGSHWADWLGVVNLKALHLPLDPWRFRSNTAVATDVVRLLLNHGGDPNEKMVEEEHAPSGKTPLGIIFRGFSYTRDIHPSIFETAQYLIDRGANVSGIVDNMTVEAVAKFEGHEPLWDALQEGISAENTETASDSSSVASDYYIPII